MNSQPELGGPARAHSGTRFSLLALDVFDTCLIRDFVSQESLWCLLGHEIIKQLPGISSAAEFARLRGSAEDEARGQDAAEDVALSDVYARIAASRGWTLAQRRQAVALEEDLESRGLRVNPLAQTLLTKADGAPVSYLTDTPHRGEFIRRCLDEHSLPAGAVLSSGDLGLRKGTGSLFREAGGGITSVAAKSCISVMTCGPMPRAAPGRACPSRCSPTLTRPGLRRRLTTQPRSQRAC